MPEKPKTPRPPRRVQAPKVRTDRRGGGPRDRRRLLLFAAIAAAGVLAVAAAAAAVVLIDGDESATTTGAASDVCKEQTYRGLNGTHTNDLNARPKWNSFPPTSGEHHSLTVIWGIYEEPVNQVQLLHNLEHGGVAIQYGEQVSQADVTPIRELWQDDPNGLVVAPLPRLRDKIVLTAWNRAKTDRRNDHGTGKLLTCTRFDEDAIDEFIEDNRFKGPEALAPEQLAPGGQ